MRGGGVRETKMQSCKKAANSLNTAKESKRTKTKKTEILDKGVLWSFQ